jgi:hypothetical protein
MARNSKYHDKKVWQLAETEKQAEVLKTARLRTLRLAKEAADRDAVGRETATELPRPQVRRVNRSTPLL